MITGRTTGLGALVLTLFALGVLFHVLGLGVLFIVCTVLAFVVIGIAAVSAIRRPA